MTEQESRDIASRQALSFLRRPAPEGGVERLAPSKSFFLISKIPEGAVQTGGIAIDWTTRNIYDIGGKLLFRDQFIPITGDNAELRIRTAASELLRSPVWSVKAGPKVDLEG